MRLWVEPSGGEQKSADIEQKMVTLIYPYPVIILKIKVRDGQILNNHHTVWINVTRPVPNYQCFIK